MKRVNILGTPYTVEYLPRSKDKYLENCDGYCDKTSKRIVVETEPEGCSLDDYPAYQRKVTRHEVIHAFLFESGLHENMSHQPAGIGSHDEQMVDWFAVQYPKIKTVYEKLEVEK